MLSDLYQRVEEVGVRGRVRTVIMMVGGGRAEEERKLRRNYHRCNRTTIFIRRKKRKRSDRHEECSAQGETMTTIAMLTGYGDPLHGVHHEQPQDQVPG